MTATGQDRGIIDAATRAAWRFYWVWLVFATSVSVLGNIAHALLVSPDAIRLLAAVASVVPPAFMLGSTHSLALSLRRGHFALLSALGLLMTLAVAACAFLLSFDALRGLAVMLGWRPRIAWLFPIAIDVSLAQATFGLLSLSSARACSHAERSPAGEPQCDTASPARRPDTARSPAQPVPSELERSNVSRDHGHASPSVIAPHGPGSTSKAPAVLSMSGSKRGLVSEDGSSDTGIERSDVGRWKPTAEQLVRNGTTSKDPETVAAILAEHAAGTAPSTISRRRRIHHSTVGRILAGAAELAG